jgi:hypothetical protein
LVPDNLFWETALLDEHFFIFQFFIRRDLLIPIHVLKYKKKPRKWNFNFLFTIRFKPTQQIFEEKKNDLLQPANLRVLKKPCHRISFDQVK